MTSSPGQTGGGDTASPTPSPREASPPGETSPPHEAGEAAPIRRRPGGRTGRVRAQVLDAVRAELGERGYDGLTLDGVAARAGVHRATVYRRWRDVGGLLADLFEATRDDDWLPRDTGSLRGDLAALNRENQDALTARPSIAEALIAAAYRSEEAARGVRRLWEDRYARCEVIVERAVRRGELPPRTDARRLLVAATAPIYHWLTLLRLPPDPDLPDRVARDVVLAASAGAFTEPPPGDARPSSEA
ncbi:TetR/AcrR family transcriptional regulator [Bailinhaonella thermotolerans]|uniref:TetR/AcrR family transcriptional regulator n=1 Tax=Bailinhaonella thermotolerans TaxID=1070861 RepID=A0A3A4AN90_9ACTN|nr:TetR/AcrR family transcriptional regulator [Bailinhaonella thermotolerans]RJL27060.1 TetR/AcrR family transcriptional regulator [Bailinhaonella thermotolerans]